MVCTTWFSVQIGPEAGGAPRLPADCARLRAGPREPRSPSQDLGARHKTNHLVPVPHSTPPPKQINNTSHKARMMKKYTKLVVVYQNTIKQVT